MICAQTVRTIDAIQNPPLQTAAAAQDAAQKEQIPALSQEEQQTLLQYDYLIKSAQLELQQYTAALKEKYKVTCCEIGKVSIVPVVFGFVPPRVRQPLQPAGAGGTVKPDDKREGVKTRTAVQEPAKPHMPEEHDKVKTPPPVKE